MCLRLRERDAKEIFNLRPHDNPLRLAHEAAWILPQGRGRVAWYQGRPAGVVGMFESWPRMWEMVMFGTDEFPHVAFAMLRWARHELRGLLTEGWGHRLQADSHVDQGGASLQWQFPRTGLSRCRYGRTSTACACSLRSLPFGR